MKRVSNLLRQAKAASIWLEEGCNYKNTEKLKSAIKEVEAMALSNELVALKRMRK